MKRRTTFSLKACLAIFLLVALGLACIRAGQWQLDRAHAREALLAAIHEGSQAKPIQLNAQQKDGPDWHPATAIGHWLNRFTLLLDNRNLNGLPGLWVATPLELQDSPGTAILVLRGWVARPMPPAQLPDIRAAEGLQIIHGTLLHQVPRLFDLSKFSSQADDTIPDFSSQDNAVPIRVQNLSLEAFAAATKLHMLPVVLEQSPTQDAGLQQAWPGPAVSPDQNYNYAMQWFAFAAIALGAAAFSIWRMARHPAISPDK